MTPSPTEAPWNILTIREGPDEGMDEEEETPEMRVARTRKEKWIRKETSTLMDLPNGITQEFTIITEILVKSPGVINGAILDEPNSGITITEVGEPSEVKVDIDIDPRMPEYVERAGATEDTLSIPVDNDDPTRILKIGSHLNPETRDDLVTFFKANLDVFALSHAEMVGIDPKVMCYRLNINPNKKGVRQKRRPVSGERVEALKEEVDRLLNVGLVKEAFYPMWLANPVLVKKPNGKWRTCVNFTDLNKTCPKDSFPPTPDITRFPCMVPIRNILHSSSIGVSIAI